MSIPESGINNEPINSGFITSKSGIKFIFDTNVKRIIIVRSNVVEYEKDSGEVISKAFIRSGDVITFID